MNRLSRQQVDRMLVHLRPYLAPVRMSQVRIIVEALDSEEHHVLIRDVFPKLFPSQRLTKDKDIANANRTISRIREDLKQAAEEAGIRLVLAVSENRKGGAGKRFLWFEGQEPIAFDNRTDELDSLDGRVVEGQRGMPATPASPRYIYLVYADGDTKSAATFARDLSDHLAPKRILIWNRRDDKHGVLTGENPRDWIRRHISQSQAALLLLSPGFFDPDGQVQTFELPQVERISLPKIPVCLIATSSQTCQSYGIDPSIVFRRRDTDSPCGSEAPKRGEKRNKYFADLADQIERKLNARTVVTGPASGRDAAWSSLPLWAQTPDVDRQSGHLVEAVPARKFRLDSPGLDSPSPAPSGQVGAVEYILDWLRGKFDARAAKNDEPTRHPPKLFVLLGEVGMGKTITCQRVVRQAREDDTLPRPAYFDLRHLSGLRDRPRVPTLEEILDECIAAGWKVGAHKPSGKELLAWAEDHPTLFVFDGLDEALVHLTERDGQELTTRLLHAQDLSDETRVLISCRTHYFKTLREQNAQFTEQQRGRFQPDDYLGLLLLPFGEQQIRIYISKALPSANVDDVIALIRSIHNLADLASRPFTLALVTDKIHELEKLRAAGRPVSIVTLYEQLVEEWLVRDNGKHHIKPEHKLELMTHLAARTWAQGTRTLQVSQLEDWFNDWLDANPRRGRRYEKTEPDMLEEDLRTATFLVREDRTTAAGKVESGFRFAHTSLQEFFLSGYLFDAVVNDDQRAWAFGRTAKDPERFDVSRETWGFFAQRLEDAPERRALLGTMSRWAADTDVQLRPVRWLLLRYVLAATGKDWPVPSLVGIDVSGIYLERERVTGPLNLEGSSWQGAQLANTRWEDVNLSKTRFVEAMLMRAEVQDCKLDQADLSASSLYAAVFRHSRLQQSRFDAAHQHRTRFVGCDMDQAHGLDSAECMIVQCRGVSNNVPDASGMKSARIRPFLGPAGEISCGDWWPDGKLAAMGGEDGLIHLCDMDTGEIVRVLEGSGGPIKTCAWSPDGQLLAGIVTTTPYVLNDDNDSVDSPLGKIRDGESRGISGLLLWNSYTGELLGGLDHGSGNVVTGCAFSPTSGALATTARDGEVRIWDVQNQSVVEQLSCEPKSVGPCAWSPDGKFLCTGTGNNGWRVWDVNTKQSVAELDGDAGPPSACAFSADSKLVAVASMSGAVWVHELETGRLVAEFGEFSGYARTIGFSSDGRELYVGADELAVYELNTNRVFHDVRLPGYVVSLQNSLPNGYSVLVLTSVGLLFDVSVPDLDHIRFLWAPNPMLVRSVAPAGNSRLVVLATDGRRDPVDTLTVWDETRSWRMRVHERTEEPISGFTFSSDGRFLAVSKRSGIELRDGTSGELLGAARFDQPSPTNRRQLRDSAPSSLIGHLMRPRLIAFSPNGAELAVVVYGTRICRRWSIPDLEPLESFSDKLKHYDRPPLHSPTGRFLAIAGETEVFIQDLETGSGRILEGHYPDIHSLSFLGESTVAVLASTGVLKMWDTQTGELLRTTEEFGAILPGPWAYSPDGSLLVVYDQREQGLVFYDMVERGTPRVIPISLPRLKSIAWSADGRLLHGADVSGAIRTWDLTTGKEARPRIHVLPEDNYAVIDLDRSRVLGASESAWRHLGWEILHNGKLERWPAETFGPLPPLEAPHPTAEAKNE